MHEWLAAVVAASRELLPLLIVLAIASSTLGSVHALLRSRERRRGAAFPFSYPVIMLSMTALAIVAVVFALPVVETTRGQLLSLLGLVLTAVIAFSSTTFVANAMAGLMLRAVGNFRVGDWVRIGDQFGRVTERGLFHTELQTEDRDLATLPNLYLVTNPVVVVRESGTIVSTRLSLGYDRHHSEVETLLADAARTSGLEDPFVQVLLLGDFSVSYRVAGFLQDVRHLLTARSRLRASVLDTLHNAGVEIVSPNFMNQRQLDAQTRVLPPVRVHPAPPPGDEAPEAAIFDKAEQASLEEMREERLRLGREIEALEGSIDDLATEEREAARQEIDRRRTRIAAIGAVLEDASEPAGGGARA